MKRRDLLPAAIVLGLAGFVGVQVATVSQPLAAAPSAPATPATQPQSPDEHAVLRHVASAIAPVRDIADIRRRVSQDGPGTYVADVLLAQDSLLVRWPERATDPLRVWIQPTSSVPDWRPEFVVIARDAFTEWGMAGIPVRFSFVADSGTADVRFKWVDRFDMDERIGNTRQIRNQYGWIVDGEITLAIHTVGHRPLDANLVQATALHEIGHLLGLDHTTNPSSVMTERTTGIHALTDADRRTARLLYLLPPGSIKG